MSKLTTIDLFAGCGGLMEGFEQSGAFQTLACVEWESAPCRNLENRLRSKWGHVNASLEVMRFDIQRTKELFEGYTDQEFGTHQGLDKLLNGRKVDVIIGGPPCQAYSLAGRIRDENGMRDDYRNYLFESYLKVVNHYQPDFFLFENVVGLLSATPDGVPIADRIQSAFNNAGYCVTGNFRNAVFFLPDYGVPQNRKRIIILGVRKATFPFTCDKIVADFYDNIMPSLKQRRRTVSDAIGDLPKLIPHVHDGEVEYVQEEGTPFVPNHIPRHHSTRDLKVFKLLTQDIESGRMEYVSIESLKRLYTAITGKQSNIHKYYVLRRDEQSNTIPAHLYKDGYRHIHPDSSQLRTLTVREAARLQTFPDDFEFLGSMGDAYKMIGNAVPPDFAKILAHAVVKIYSKYKPDRVDDLTCINEIQDGNTEHMAVPTYKQAVLDFESNGPKPVKANVQTELDVTQAFTCTGPYLILIMLGIKRVENRIQIPQPKNGRCAISCSRSFCETEYNRFVQWAHNSLSDSICCHIPAWDVISSWPGAIVATCCYAAREAVPNEPWYEGYPVSWDLSNIKMLQTPIPCKGKLGMWRIPKTVNCG